MGTEVFLSANPVEGLEQQIVFGIATGSIYASLALALVLIYRAMEAINFAQGEMATFSTFIAWSLMANFHMSFWIAFPLVVVLSFVGGVALERVVIRPVERAPILTTILVTLGLFAIFNGLSGLIWGYTIRWSGSAWAGCWRWAGAFRRRSERCPG